MSSVEVPTTVHHPIRRMFDSVIIPMFHQYNLQPERITSSYFSQLPISPANCPVMDLRRRSSQRDNEPGKIHVRNRLSQPPQRADRDRRTNASSHSRTHEPQSSGRHINDNENTHSVELRRQQGSTNAPERRERRTVDSGIHSQGDSRSRSHTSESSEVNPNRSSRLPSQYESNYASQAQTGIGDSGSHSNNYNRSLPMTLPVVLPPMSQPPPPLPYPQPVIVNTSWKIPKRKAPTEEPLNTSENKKERENSQHLKTANWFASRSQQIELCDSQDYSQRSVPIDDQAATSQMPRPYRKPSRHYDRPQQRGTSVARFNFQEIQEREVSASNNMPNYGDNRAGSGNMHHIDVLRQDQRRQKDPSYDARQPINAPSFGFASRNYDDRSSEFQSSQHSEFQDQRRPGIGTRQEQQNDQVHILNQWRPYRDVGQRRVCFQDSNERFVSRTKPCVNLPMSPIPSPPLPPMSPPPPPPPPPVLSTSGNVHASKQIPSILSNRSFYIWPEQAKFQSAVNSNESRYGANTRTSRPMRSKSVVNIKYTQSTSSITAPRLDREGQSSALKTTNFVSPRTARLSESVESNSRAEVGHYRGSFTTGSSGFQSSDPSVTVPKRGYSQFVLQPQQERLNVISRWGPATSQEAESTQSHERIRITVPNSGGIEPSYTQPSPKIPKQGERTIQEMNVAEAADREIMVRHLEEDQSRPGPSYHDVGPRGGANSEQNQCRIATRRSFSDRADVFNASRMPQLTSNDRIPVSNFARCSVRPFSCLDAEDEREHSRETEEYNSEESEESVATAVPHPDQTGLFKIRPEPETVLGDPNPWPGFTGYPDHIFEHCETEDDERCAKEKFELWNPHLFPQKVDIHKEVAQLKAMEDSGAQEELGLEKSRLDWLRSLSAKGGPANFGPNMLDRIVDYVRNLEKSGQPELENHPGDEQRILKVIVPNLPQSALHFQNSASGRVVNFQRSAQDHAER